jgi:hypothetical protein
MEYYSETQILKILLAAKPDDYLPVSKYINLVSKRLCFHDIIFSIMEVKASPKPIQGEAKGIVLSQRGIR